MTFVAEQLIPVRNSWLSSVRPQVTLQSDLLVKVFGSIFLEIRISLFSLAYFDQTLDYLLQSNSDLLFSWHDKSVDNYNLHKILFIPLSTDNCG